MTPFRQYCEEKGEKAYLPFMVGVTWEECESIVDVEQGRRVTLLVNGDRHTYRVQADSKAGLMWTIKNGEPHRESVFRFIDNFNPRR